VSVTIDVVGNTADEALNALREQLTPRRMAAAVGPALARQVQRHLAGLGTNKRGWPSTRFWARAARATSWQRVPEGAVVSVNQIGVRQRFQGGIIKPVNARALTIPISPVAYGKTASEFPGSFLLKTKKGTFIVQPGEEVSEKTSRMTKRTKGAGGNASRRIRAALNFLFVLKGQVNQEADPSVLPSRESMMETAKTALRGALITKLSGDV